MSMKICNSLHNLIQDNKIFYMAHGKLTQSVLHTIVATIREGVYDSFLEKEYSSDKIDNLIAVIIEMVQNVDKYKEEIKYYNHDLILVTIEKSIAVSTSNLIKKEKKDKLIKNINFLNSLDNAELRKYSREVMKKNRNKNFNSAGLGLIEIARLSEKNIEYQFTEDIRYDDFIYFNITTTL